MRIVSFHDDKLIIEFADGNQNLIHLSFIDNTILCIITPSTLYYNSSYPKIGEFLEEEISKNPRENYRLVSCTPIKMTNFLDSIQLNCDLTTLELDAK